MLHRSLTKPLKLVALLLSCVLGISAALSRQASLVTAVSLTAVEPNLSRPCPIKVNFTGSITTNGPGTVTYTFTRSDGATAPTFTLDFKEAGTQSVSTDWTLGHPTALPAYEGWQTIKILSPNLKESNRETGAFAIKCDQNAQNSSRLTFSVDTKIKPLIAQLPKLEGELRPVARVIGPGNVKADFVENELIMVTDNEKLVSELVERWNGKVLKTVVPRELKLPNTPAMHLIRIDASQAQTANISKNILSFNKSNGGTHRVSSQAGLQLIAVAASEAAAGTPVSMNFLLYPNDFLDRSTVEAESGNGSSWTRNAYQWPYFNTGSPQNMGVGEAWRELTRAPRARLPVKIAVLDNGFVRHADTPAGEFIGRVAGPLGTPNPSLCSGGTPCPFHGANVTDALMGIPDNRSGAAGPAGPIAEAVMVERPAPDIFFLIDAIANTLQGLATRPQIINMSFSTSIPAALAVLPGGAINVFTAGLRASGILLFASAPNDGLDVDALDGIGPITWERDWIMPCENDGVICVGGMANNSRQRHPASAFGSRFGTQPTSIDIFGPFTVWVSDESSDRPDGTSPVAKRVSGNSFASPFVAGVAALIWAAMPAPSANEVESILFATAQPGIAPGDAPLRPDARAAVCRALGGCAPERPVPSTATNGRFRITINGFTCNRPTADNILQIDGVDDEVFLNAELRLYSPTRSFDIDTVRSLVMGDTNNHPDRIRAGSGHNLFGGNGGFKDGDSFPSATPWVSVTPPLFDRPPLLVWEGELARDQDALALITSIWESDENPRLLVNEWNQSVLNTWAAIDTDMRQAIARRSGPETSTDVNVTLRRLFDSVRVGMGNDEKDRPIGMAHRTTHWGYLPQLLVLTYDAADRTSRTDLGRGAGVIPLLFRDHEDLRGDYTVFLRIERIR
jgi:subtilase family protein